ncbi:MAG: hypothetical protein Q8P18_21445 [Pseudomonadota bacterium]|nr:hypothetical protein [Pseudomonadota bacterium]
MSDTVSFRLDGDIASVARVNAERAGLPMSEYVNELIRMTLRAPRGIQPVYVPPGRSDEATAMFVKDKGSNVDRLWVFRDLVQPIVWMLPAVEEDYSEFSVRIRPRQGRAFAVARDNLVAWTAYSSAHERIGLMYDWLHAGATLHPWDTTNFRAQTPSG